MRLKLTDYKIKNEELMKKWLDEDDINSYNELVRRFKDRLVNFIHGFLYDIDRAHDLSQDTLLKLFTHKHSYEPRAALSTWLFTIAGNLARTELRKIKRRKTKSFSQLSGDEYEFNLDRMEILEDDDSSEDMNVIRDGISKLNEDFRVIIIMRDFQELSYDIISKILKVPVGTVKSRINRARLKLHDIVNEES